MEDARVAVLGESVDLLVIAEHQRRQDWLLTLDDAVEDLDELAREELGLADLVDYDEATQLDGAFEGGDADALDGIDVDVDAAEAVLGHHIRARDDGRLAVQSNELKPCRLASGRLPGGEAADRATPAGDDLMNEGGLPTPSCR
jgi:hypothetical protein